MVRELTHSWTNTCMYCTRRSFSFCHSRRGFGSTTERVSGRYFPEIGMLDVENFRLVVVFAVRNQASFSATCSRL